MLKVNRVFECKRGIQIPVGNGKHVHFVGRPLGNSTVNDGHFHQFQFSTLIDSPLT